MLDFSTQNTFLGHSLRVTITIYSIIIEIATSFGTINNSAIHMKPRSALYLFGS